MDCWTGFPNEARLTGVVTVPVSEESNLDSGTMVVDERSSILGGSTELWRRIGWETNRSGGREDVDERLLDEEDLDRDGDETFDVGHEIVTHGS